MPLNFGLIKYLYLPRMLMLSCWHFCFILLLQQVSEFDLFTLDDVDSAFQNVTRLAYSQNHHMSGSCWCQFFKLFFFGIRHCQISHVYICIIWSPLWGFFEYLSYFLFSFVKKTRKEILVKLSYFCGVDMICTWYRGWN